MVRFLFHRFVFLLVLANLRLSESYDVGSIYPAEMPDPITAFAELGDVGTAFLINRPSETPIAIHSAFLGQLCVQNCIAVHDLNVLNGITRQRPLLVTPTFGHNSWSRMMCIAQCIGQLFEPSGPDQLGPLWEKWNLPVSGINPEILTALQNDDQAQVATIVEESDYDPLIMAQLVALEIVEYSFVDGWNAPGFLTFDDKTGQPVPCTAHCAPYADIIGYYPRNNPGESKKNAGKSKYVVTGNDKYWQPIREDNGFGYFSRQEHVVPHVGTTTQPQLRDYQSAPDPKYNYREEALQVVEELRLTAIDANRKAKIRFYDNKLLVRNTITLAMREQYSDFSFEDEQLLAQGIQFAELDAIMNAWREKVLHDLVRPTTVINRWGSDELDTYGGDPNSSSSTIIAARDFEAYIRVMPHSEYPSASACICTAYEEFTNNYIAEKFPDDRLVNLKYGPDGYSLNCDGSIPFSLQRGCTEAEAVTIADMETLKEECSQSRLWGGMHFTKAIPAAQELCAGLGLLALELIEVLQNGSDFGSPYFPGNPRPTCA